MQFRPPIGQRRCVDTKECFEGVRLYVSGRMVNLLELIQQLSPFETPKINHVQRGFITDVRAQTLILILNRKVGNCLDVNSTILRTKNVCITEKGRELLEKVADYENERVNRIMQTLSVEELTDL